MITKEALEGMNPAREQIVDCDGDVWEVHRVEEDGVVTVLDPNGTLYEIIWSDEDGGIIDIVSEQRMDELNHPDAEVEQRVVGY